jgi:hypothetical protein
VFERGVEGIGGEWVVFISWLRLWVVTSNGFTVSAETKNSVQARGDESANPGTVFHFETTGVIKMATAGNNDIEVLVDFTVKMAVGEKMNKTVAVTANEIQRPVRAKAETAEPRLHLRPFSRPHMIENLRNQ